MLFADRSEAGRRLARRLEPFRAQHPVVLALPRGGVPVGFEVAQALDAPLDLVLVRKIGAPGQPELAIGAVAEGDPPELVTDPRLLEMLGVSDDYLEATKAQEMAELQRRRAAYLGERPRVAIEGRTAIVVDDGLATGATMLAALRATRRRAPSRLIVAVPVASPNSLHRVSGVADETVCLGAPAEFYAVGQFYRQFPQLTDRAVVDLLARAAGFGRSGAP